MRNEALKAKQSIWEKSIEWAKKKKIRMTTGLFKRMFQSSIYNRHQGPRECARRIRQRERGIIQ